jgi:hypothetical protein
VILENDDDLDKADIRGKAKGAFSNINIKHIKRDANLHNTFATLKLALAPIKPINASGL